MKWRFNTWRFSVAIASGRKANESIFYMKESNRIIGPGPQVYAWAWAGTGTAANFGSGPGPNKKHTEPSCVKSLCLTTGLNHIKLVLLLASACGSVIQLVVSKLTLIEILCSLFSAYVHVQVHGAYTQTYRVHAKRMQMEHGMIFVHVEGFLQVSGLVIDMSLSRTMLSNTCLWYMMCFCICLFHLWAHCHSPTMNCTIKYS